MSELRDSAIAVLAFSCLFWLNTLGATALIS